MTTNWASEASVVEDGTRVVRTGWHLNSFWAVVLRSLHFWLCQGQVDCETSCSEAALWILSQLSNS